MITHSICDVMTDDLLDAINGIDDDYRLALYAPEAKLNAKTTRYAPEHEIASSDSYAAGGVQLKRVRTRSADGAHLSFTVPLMAGDIRAAGGLIYNKTRNRAMFVIDFGRTYQSTSGPFEIKLPIDLYTLP